MGTHNRGEESLQPSTLPKHSPVSPERLEECLEVLRLLASNEELLFDRNFRELRKVVLSLNDVMKSKQYGGEAEESYRVKAQLRKEMEGRKARQKMLDANHINKARLRLNRLSALTKLSAQNTEGTIAMIADGIGEHVDLSQGSQSPRPPLITGDAGASDTGSETLNVPPGQNAIDRNDERVTQSDAHSAKLHQLRSCYICKVRYSTIHEFYDQLCPACAALNYAKRFQRVDLSGKVAIVTGARVKIGFCIAIRLLSMGAYVIATTRFPVDAARRYAEHKDYAYFKDRLKIVALDLRDIRRIQRFVHYVYRSQHRLDIIINNACQTIRRPAAFYKELVQNETLSNISGKEDLSTIVLSLEKASEHPVENSENGTQICGVDESLEIQRVAALSLANLTKEDENIDDVARFPSGMRDVNGQQLDLRQTNSWLLRLHEVSTAEVAEVFAVNTLAPFILNSKLQCLMERTADDAPKFIVNVSAMEGKFYRKKQPTHPHTNMAKAALNMMTRTCAGDLMKRGIYMNSVDTGWINDENPLPKAARIAQSSGFQTPIDEEDAAARVLDCVIVGVKSGRPCYGLFLKDYMPTEW